MIVCLCRGVSEREIVDATRNGASSLDDISTSCAGAGRDCGTCRPVIEDILAEARGGTATAA